MSVEIRRETAADIPAIEAVTASAFLNAPHTSHTEQGRARTNRVCGLIWIRETGNVADYRAFGLRDK